MPTKHDDELSVIEQHVMLALNRLYPSGYGVAVRDYIERETGKALSFGAVYAVLERLEARGMVVSREGDPTPERGGRRKLYYQVTGVGRKALNNSVMALNRLGAQEIVGGVPA